MFLYEGLLLDSETLEYGWLVEVIIGDFIGKLILVQVIKIIFINFLLILYMQLFFFDIYGYLYVNM